MSSINRVLRNLAASKEQTAQHLSAAAADSVYDKLRMFNGQAAAAAGWAWYGAAASASAANHAHASSAHLGLGGHAGQQLTSQHFGTPGAGGLGSASNGTGTGSTNGDRESADEKKHLSGRKYRRYLFCFYREGNHGRLVNKVYLRRWIDRENECYVVY